jgi:hypothetical protein
MLRRHASWAVASISLATLAACAHADAPAGSTGAAQTSPAVADPFDAAVETLAIAPPPDAGAPSAVAPAASAPSPASASSAPSSGADSALDPAFVACHADADCTAVRKNGCCNHGELEAVATSQVAAYKASFTCRTHMMCPQYLRRDLRVAVCDTAASRCKMVAPAP